MDAFPGFVFSGDFLFGALLKYLFGNMFVFFCLSKSKFWMLCSEASMPKLIIIFIFLNDGDF